MYVHNEKKWMKSDEMLQKEKKKERNWMERMVWLKYYAYYAFTSISLRIDREKEMNR